jgi:CheY-like chemotaxis protein
MKDNRLDHSRFEILHHAAKEDGVGIRIPAGQQCAGGNRNRFQPSPKIMNTLLIEPETVTSLSVSEEIPSFPHTNSPRRTGGTGMQARILYVDDEPVMRSLGQLVLARSGYAVDTAADGMEAWSALQEHDYNLLITDNHMPGLSGLELIRKVRLARMGVPIILASAVLGMYSINALPLTECGAMLAKPFTPEQLVSVVSDVLRTTFSSRTTTSNGLPASGQYQVCLDSHRASRISD